MFTSLSLKFKHVHNQSSTYSSNTHLMNTWKCDAQYLGKYIKKSSEVNPLGLEKFSQDGRPG